MNNRQISDETGLEQRLIVPRNGNTTGEETTRGRDITLCQRLERSLTEIFSSVLGKTKAGAGSFLVGIHKAYCLLEFGTKAMLPYLGAAVMTGIIVRIAYLGYLAFAYGEVFRKKEDDHTCHIKYKIGNETFTEHGNCTEYYLPAQAEEYEQDRAQAYARDHVNNLYFDSPLSYLHWLLLYIYPLIVFLYAGRVAYERNYHVQPKNYINYLVRSFLELKPHNDYCREREALNKDFSRKIPEGGLLYAQSLTLVAALFLLLSDVSMSKAANTFKGKRDEVYKRQSENCELCTDEANKMQAVEEAGREVSRTIADYTDMNNSTVFWSTLSTGILVFLLLAGPSIVSSILARNQIKTKQEQKEIRTKTKEMMIKLINSDNHLYKGLINARDAEALRAKIVVIHGDNQLTTTPEALNIEENSPPSTWLTPSDSPYPSLQRLCKHLPDHDNYQIDFYKKKEREDIYDVHVGSYTRARGFFLPEIELGMEDHTDEGMGINFDDLIAAAYYQALAARATEVKVRVNNDTETTVNLTAVQLQQFINDVNRIRGENTAFFISFVGANEQQSEFPIPCPPNRLIDFSYIQAKLVEAIQAARTAGATNAQMFFMDWRNGNAQYPIPTSTFTIAPGTNEAALAADIIGIAMRQRHPLQLEVSFTKSGTASGCFYFGAHYARRAPSLVGGAPTLFNNMVMTIDDGERFQSLYNNLMAQNFNPPITYFSATTSQGRGRGNNRLDVENRDDMPMRFAHFMLLHATDASHISAHTGNGIQQFEINMGRNFYQWTRKANATIQYPEQVITADGPAAAAALL